MQFNLSDSFLSVTWTNRIRLSLGFQQKMPFASKKNENHIFATQFPSDIDAYIADELESGGLLGPFKNNPIAPGHQS